MGLIIVVDVCIYALIFSSKLHIELHLIVKLFLIVISILPFVCIKEFISHTIRILDYFINKNKLYEMECCNYGKVIDKYTMPRGNSRDYYIVVNVNSNDIKIKSKSYEYRLLDVNDEVIVFSIEGNNKSICL